MLTLKLPIQGLLNQNQNKFSKTFSIQKMKNLIEKFQNLCYMLSITKVSCEQKIANFKILSYFKNYLIKITIISIRTHIIFYFQK